MNIKRTDDKEILPSEVESAISSGLNSCEYYFFAKYENSKDECINANIEDIKNNQIGKFDKTNSLPIYPVSISSSGVVIYRLTR